MQSRDKVLIWNSGSHCLGGRTREQFIRILKDKLKGRIREAWLFGSVATGKFKHSSDVDLIIVCDSTLPFLKRPEQFADLWELTDRLDLLVYTPEEFRNLTENPTAGFWSDVMKEMVRVL